MGLGANRGLFCSESGCGQTRQYVANKPMRLANIQQRAGARALAIGSHKSEHVLLPDCNNPRAVHSNSTVLQSTHYRGPTFVNG
jgi:hypothetical protein